MPKLPKKAIRNGRTYGRTDPNYGKALILRIEEKILKQHNLIGLTVTEILIYIRTDKQKFQNREPN